MKKTIPTVDEYLTGQEAWKDILMKLRSILRETDMEEGIKWGIPVYSLEGKNIVGISAFKSYAGLWFYQGALLKDEAGTLMNAQEGKTQAMRQWRFTDLSEVDPGLVKAYILESIANHKAGLKIKPVRGKDILLPSILEKQFEQDPALRTQFQALSPGKQREFVLYIEEAKRAETQKSRLEKIIPLIRTQTGLNDKYK